jgi:hypothetical protein
VHINLETAEKISQTINNVLPFVSYRHKFSDSRSLNFRYATNSGQPSLTQLQPVPDNTNPNYIVKGNPDLRPSFSHNFTLNFYSFKPISGSNIWSNLGVYTTENAFSSSVFYDSIGRTISQPVNVNGNYNGYFYFGMELPLHGKMITLHPSGNYNFNSSVNYINEEKNISKESTPGFELSFGFEKDTLEFSIGGNYSYNSSSSSLNNQSDKSFSTYGYNASFETELWWKLLIKTDARYNLNAQRTQGYNINTLLWNASLSKTFFKNENFIVSVIATDILNQNVNLNRDIQDNVISDVKTTVIGRYILLKAVLKFNSTKTKEEENDW